MPRYSGLYLTYILPWTREGRKCYTGALLLVSNNHMQKSIIAVIIILVLATAGYWWFTRDTVPGDEGTIATSSIPLSEQEIVTVKHAYKSGKHVMVGSLMVPTPCDELSWDARVAESMPEQVSISFTIVKKEGTEVCAQVLTAKQFKVEAIASASSTWSATLNGTPLQLNIIEAGEGEDLEKFEVEIKG